MSYYFLAHSGKVGMKWYEHRFGRWQRQAQYANGQPDPDAKPTPQGVTGQPKARHRMLSALGVSGEEQNRMAARAAQERAEKQVQVEKRQAEAQANKQAKEQAKAEDAQKRAEAAAAKAQQDAEREQKRIENIRQKALNTSATDGNKVLSEAVQYLSNEEIDQVIARIEKNRKLAAITDKPQNLQQAQQSVKAATQVAQNGQKKTNALLKKLGESALQATGNLATAGFTYAGKKAVEKLIGTEKALEIFDQNALNNTWRAKSSTNKKFTQEILNDMQTNPDKYSVADLQAASQQVEYINKIRGKKEK